jgi:hypothetical protein
MLQGLREISLAVVVSVAVVGCAGNSGNAVSLAPLDHSSAVRGFMDAVKSQDITTMAGLWGTRDGVAANSMDREELVRRLRVIMTYLAHDEYELSSVGNDLLGTESQRVVTVRVSRDNCVSEVPFTVVRADDGWLVQSMDLEATVSRRGNCSG